MPREPAVTSRIMAAVHSRDTRPEMRLRKALFARGYRYRVHYRSVAGKPDIAFPRKQVAIFVDGDFWHGNSWKARGFKSLEAQFRAWNNPEFWIAKVKSNIARDRKVNRELSRQGWIVLRVWESQLAESFQSCLRSITRTIQKA